MAPEPTFAVLTNFDEEYSVGFLCAAVNEAYCRRWGHRFLPCVLSKEEMKQVCAGRHFAWAKLALFTWLLTPERSSPAAREVFEAWLGESGRRELLESVEYLVWIDGDAMVLDHSVPLAQFVEGPARKKALVIAEDMSDADYVNTGVFLTRVESSWARDLWWNAWQSASSWFHHAPFWDQSGVCEELARRKEFNPTNLGGHPRRRREANEAPWFSWMGGALHKETTNLQVVDVTSLQFCNPLHAQFVLHLCGYSNKLALCRDVVASGALRAVDPASVPMEELHGAGRTGLRGRQWEDAWSALKEAVEANRPFPWGWPATSASSSGARSVVRAADLEEVEQWWISGEDEEPVMVAVPSPKAWSLRALRETYDKLQVPVDDCAPVRMTDPPEAKSGCRSLRAPLGKLCDYVRGFPPPCSHMLGRLDPRRQWRCTRWQPWGPGAEGLEQPPAPHSGLARLWAAGGEAFSVAESFVHVAPPGARVRLHRPFAERGAHAAIWQLEGEVEYALLEPKALPKPSGGPPLFDASQAALDPWALGQDVARGRRVVLRAGEVLLLPVDWWIASSALSPALAIWAPWVHTARASQHVELSGKHGQAAALFQNSKDPRVRALAERAVGEAPLGGMLKETLRSGRGPLPRGGFHAVVHSTLYSPDGRGLRNSRLPPSPSPQLIPLGFGHPTDKEIMAQAIMSMAVGEHALVAVRGGAPSAVAMVAELELLATLEPEAEASEPEPAIAGGWSWFGHPDNWLGSPKDHMPVDQVGLARERAERERQEAQAARAAAAAGAAHERAAAHERHKAEAEVARPAASVERRRRTAEEARTGAAAAGSAARFRATARARALAAPAAPASCRARNRWKPQRRRPLPAVD